MAIDYWHAWISLRWRRRGYRERGANLVEYILLIAFIAIIVVIAVKVLGRTVSAKFSSTNSSLQ